MRKVVSDSTYVVNSSWKVTIANLWEFVAEQGNYKVVRMNVSCNSLLGAF